MTSDEREELTDERREELEEHKKELVEEREELDQRRGELERRRDEFAQSLVDLKTSVRQEVGRVPSLKTWLLPTIAGAVGLTMALRWKGKRKERRARD